MNQSTRSLIGEFGKLDFFNMCGLPGDASVIHVDDWDTAIWMITHPDWTDYKEWFWSDRLRVLSMEFPQEIKTWNDVVDEVKSFTEPLVDEIERARFAGQEVPKDVFDAIRWDLVQGCMEREYEEIVPNSIYTKLAEQYLAGRLPCGWDGDYPDGSVVVF